MKKWNRAGNRVIKERLAETVKKMKIDSIEGK
jgi:hypothetical protein